MRNKKLFSIFAASAMVASTLLAGCGNQNESVPNSNETVAENQQSQEEGNESGEKPKITVSIYDRGTLDPSEGTMDNNRWTKWINENAPVEVEFVSIPRWTSIEKFNALFASDSAPDLILNWGMPNNWVTDGLLMPLEDVINQYSTEYKALMEEYPAMKKAGSVDGELYYFTALSPLQPNHTLVIRTDWLEKLGLEVPKTEEEFYDVAVAFATQDPDGNGQDDTFGMSLSFVSGMMIDQMYGLQNDGFVVEDGKMVFAWDRYEACTKMKKALYDSGAVDKDYAADTSGEQSYQDFINGKLGMIGLNGGANVSMRTTYSQFKENNPDGEFEIIALPTTSIGEFGACLAGGPSVCGAINADCENPEAVMKYIDWLNSSPDIYNTLVYGGEEYATCTEDGVWAAKDAEKSKKEVYGTDYVIPICTLPIGVTIASNFDKNNEVDAACLEYLDQATKAYCNEKYPYQQNYAEPRPALDSQLSVILTNTYTNATDGPIATNLAKAIVGGSEYSVEQAIADSKKACEDGNGQKVLDFYSQWYEENKNNLITDEERYALFVK